MSNALFNNQMSYANASQVKQMDAVLGNSIDIKMSECTAAEVRADVVVESAQGTTGCNIVRLWGQIKDCNGSPVPNALLKLVKVVCDANGTKYQGIAHNVSDCEGFYQFDLCYCDGRECYKVLVSKANTGQEQILQTGSGNCDACSSNGPAYSPCEPYNPIVTTVTPGSCDCNTVPVPPCPPMPPRPVPPCPPVPPRPVPPCPPVPPRPVPPCPPMPPRPVPPCPPVPPIQPKTTGAMPYQYPYAGNMYQSGTINIPAPCGQ